MSQRPSPLVLWECKPSHPHLLFVYGTLKRGHFNNQNVLRGADFVTATKIPASHGFSMVQSATIGFPFVAPATTVDASYGLTPRDIHGEVWAISDTQLDYCDQLEGVPIMYSREVVSLVEGPCTCFLYVASPRMLKQVLGGYGYTQISEWPATLPGPIGTHHSSSSPSSSSSSKKATNHV